MVARRDVLTLLGAIGAAACSRPGAASRPASLATGSPEPPVSVFALERLVDLVPAAGLVWLVEARPRALLGNAILSSVVTTLAPEELFLTFALRHGGIDLRHAEAIVVAGLEDVWLGIARVPVDPTNIEAAFSARALHVDGRAVEGRVTRFWGSVEREPDATGTPDGGPDRDEEREQIAVFGQEAVGLERGRFGPLRVATYFAEGKLKRSLPALRAEPLSEAAQRLGEAPVRAFAPGPFVGAWADGLGGLLRASTSVAVGLAASENPSALAIRIVLTGAWGADARAAADRLAAAFRVLAEDPLGRLAGVDRPLAGPNVTSDARGVGLDVALDPAVFARGLRAATSASLAEIMAF